MTLFKYGFCIQICIENLGRTVVQIAALRALRVRFWAVLPGSFPALEFDNNIGNRHSLQVPSTSRPGLIFPNPSIWRLLLTGK